MTDRLSRSPMAEHAEINERVVAMLASPDLPTAIGALDDFEPLLLQHFRHEDAPDGLIGILGVTRQADAGVRRIRAEHAQFLADVRELRDEARGMLSDDLDGEHLPYELSTIRRRIVAFSDRLLAHEHMEMRLLVSSIALLRAKTQTTRTARLLERIAV